SPVAKIRDEARAMSGLIQTEWVKDWLAGADQLAPRETRTVYVAGDRSRALDEDAWRALPEMQRAALTARTFDEEGYYETGYGTPIAYARAYDLVGRAGLYGISGKKVLDFGYGEIGGLQLLALAGADATGIDVDPTLAALYSRP